MNERGKKVDKTFLSLDNAERRGFIHRDYIAHCFRWTHAAKHIQKRWREATILDVGCGKEMPFPKLIYTSKLRPLQYVGLDVDETPMPEMLEKVTFPCERLIGDVAEAESYKDLGFKKQPNFITCFEMMEHVELEHAQRCLTAIKNLMAHDGLFMVSTPVYNLKDVAANHVNEMTYECFGAMLEDAGFSIVNHYGTFASQSDLKQIMTDVELELFERLRCYYDSNVLSVVFAPLFPKHSRNVLWDCGKATKAYERQFPPLAETPKPWGSSEAAQ
jgi:2-polyprenyl-3-methyl-5-hydroxy-6-metoxy-1,4-benzoquinol methylase